MSKNKKLYVEKDRSGHYQFKCKCLSCNLHFMVCSYQSNWHERTMHCPECGGTQIFAMAKESVSEEIYQVVPGNSPPISRPGMKAVKLTLGDLFKMMQE